MELHIHMRFPKRNVDRKLFKLIDAAFEAEAFALVSWPSGAGDVIGILIREPDIDWVKYPARKRFDIPQDAIDLTIRYECETPIPRDIWINISLSKSSLGQGYESEYLWLGSKQTTMGQEDIDKRNFALRRYRIARFLHQSLGAYDTKACHTNDPEEEYPLFKFTATSCPELTEEDLPLD